MESNSRGAGALDAFLNLLSLITVGWLAWSFGAVVFAIIDHVWGAPPEYYYIGSQLGLKSGIASLLVITPICLGVIDVMHHYYRNGKLNHESGIYRWLTYVMLLISALNIIGSLIGIIFQFLNGDYTIPSLLKVGTVLIIASAIFSYYFYDLRRTSYAQRSNVSAVAMTAVIVLAIAAVVGGIMIIDSPQEARAKRNDQQRVNDLSNLNSYVASQYQNTSVLPASLGDYVMTDPSSDQPYEYRVLGVTEYELCATFESAVESARNEASYRAGYEPWYRHGQGRQCFTQTVQSKLTQ